MGENSFLRKKALKPVIIIVIAGIAITGGYYIFKKFRTISKTQTSAGWVSMITSRGDIEVKVSGTGTVEPVSRFDIVPLIKGNILKAPFEKGDEVKKGDLLYEIDDSEQYFNIEKTRASIEKLEIGNQQTDESVANLILTSPLEGRIINLTVSEGDQIGGNNAKIASIVNDLQLTAIIPFNSFQAETFAVGEEAKLLLPQFMEYVKGEISYIGNTTKPSKDGTSLCDVEIRIENPGTITEGTEATGIVNTPGGDIISPSTGKIMFTKGSAIMAKSSGTVKNVFAKENDWVVEGQKILELENENLLVTQKKNLLDMKDLQLSLDSQIKKLDDYNILSPIDGIIISKTYKAGDTIGSSTSLMTIADMSKMVFSIDVDELDIAKISVGQKASVTADALVGKTFEAEVTNIPLEGKSQSGVTVYKVEVTINEPGELMPGMNVNAQIITDSKKDILRVPMSAVTKIRDKTYVYVGREIQNNLPENTTDRQQIQQQEQERIPAADGQTTPGEQQERIPAAGGQQGGQRFSGGQQNWQQNREDWAENQGTPTTSQRPANTTQNRQAVPTTGERQLREVVVGINNEDYIEIISGLSEGETIYVAAASENSGTSNYNNSIMPNFMGGGGRNIPIMGGDSGIRAR